MPGDVSTLDDLAHYIEITAGEVGIQWPASISNQTESYQLIFIDTPTGAPFGQSGIFNLTIPPREPRNATLGTLGTTGAAGPHTAPSSGLSSGAIAGIVIGVLFAVSTLLACLWFILRLRHRRKLRDAVNSELKNELDSVATSKPRAELGDQKPRAELHDEKKDFLNFELPSTPPCSPTEKDVPEIPAAEMPARRPPSSYLSSRNPDPKGPLSETSENTDTTLVSEQGNQQHAIARKPVPVPTRQSIAEEVGPSVLPVLEGENRPSLSSPDRPMNARADTASVSSARTPRKQRTPFQAALHDLISQKLRRPGA